MLYELCGVAFSLTSRALSGEVELPESLTEQIETLRDGVESTTTLVGDLDISKPVSWARFAGRLLDRLAGNERQPSVWEILEAERCNDYQYGLGAMWTSVFMRSERELVLQTEDDEVWKVMLPNGSRYFVALEPGELAAGSMERSSNTFNPYLPDDRDERELVLRGVAEVFWRGRDAVLLDATLAGESFSTLPLTGPSFHGSLRELLDRWEAYLDAGIRRNVLLQGRPGTGKSTFALHAARQLSTRTLMLTADSCESLSDGQWYTLLKVLEPTMVIMDDIDRLSHLSLERKLRMFEEGYCEVPFIIFTSNDFERLPLPMRRPGRIDQILEVEEPDDTVLSGVIERIATREGVEVAVTRMGELVAMSRELSMAHVVEKLRRARVEGWDSLDVEGDITFSKGYRDADSDDSEDDDLAAAE